MLALLTATTIPIEMFTRQIRQNLKSATVKITNAPKIHLILSRSFRWVTWHYSADIQGPLLVNLPELPIRNSEEFEVAKVKITYVPKNPEYFLLGR